MKQLLLLVAIYSLIINQSSKSETPKMKTFTPVNEIKRTDPIAPQARINPHVFVAPLFTYSSYRLMSSYNYAARTSP